MKAVLLNFFGLENRGDAAILSETISVLKKIDPEIHLDLVTLHSKEISLEQLGVKPIITKNLLSLDPKSSILFKGLEFLYLSTVLSIYSYFYRLLNKKLKIILTSNLFNIIETYHEADVVFSMGGGYLTSGKGLSENLFFLTRLFPIWLSIKFNKKTILLWQSVGPFTNDFQYYLVKKVLKKCERIYIRESISLDFVRSFLGHSDRVVKSSDIAFYLESFDKDRMLIELQELGIQGKPLVGITARSWFKRGSNERVRYITAFIETIDFLLISGYQVILIPQVTSEFEELSDRVFLEKIMESFPGNRDLFLPNKEFSHEEMKGLYGNLHFLIGMRMHSNIFALTGGVPCIAVAYEHKTEGIMGDLGLIDWVISVNKLESKVLISYIKRMEQERESYINLLNKNILINKKKIDDSIQDLRQTLLQSI